MGEKIGTFGSVTYDGSEITIDIDPDCLGSLALTARDGRIECYWDGNQWVCQALTFGSGESQATST